MSIIKDKVDFYYNFAYRGLLELGAIKTCDAHDDYYYSTVDESERDKYYAILTNKLKKQDGEIQDFVCFDEQIKRVFDEVGIGYNCPRCEDAFNED